MSEIAVTHAPARYANVGRQTVGPEWGMTAHAHDYHQLVLVLRGAQWVKIGGQRIVARAGDLLLYPAGQAHVEGVEAAPLSTIFIGFFWSELRPGMPIHLRDTKGRIQALVEWIYAEQEAYFAGVGGYVETMVQGITAEYLRLGDHREDETVERTRAYVRHHIDQPITLDDLAAGAGLSKYHFVRRYRALTGLTPMADTRRIRLETARHLLLTTNLPLKAVAMRVGLANEYHLSRLLRSNLGIGVRDLRRLLER